MNIKKIGNVNVEMTLHNKFIYNIYLNKFGFCSSNHGGLAQLLFFLQLTYVTKPVWQRR